MQYPGQLNVAGWAMETSPAPVIARHTRQAATASMRSVSGLSSCWRGLRDRGRAGRERPGEYGGTKAVGRGDVDHGGFTLGRSVVARIAVLDVAVTGVVLGVVWSAAPGLQLMVVELPQAALPFVGL